MSTTANTVEYISAGVIVEAGDLIVGAGEGLYQVLRSSGLADGQVWAWDADTSAWVATTPGAGGSTTLLATASTWVPVYPDTAGVQPDLDIIAPFVGTVAISRYHTGTAPAVGTAGVTLTNTRDSDLILDAVDAIAGIGTAPVAMTVANADVQAGDLLTLSVDYSATVTPAAAADGTPQSTIVFVYTFTGV